MFKARLSLCINMKFRREKVIPLPLCHKSIYKKSRLRETLNLVTWAVSSTNTKKSKIRVKKKNKNLFRFMCHTCRQLQQPLRTPPLCTVGWFAQTEVCVLGNLPIYPNKIKISKHKIFSTSSKKFSFLLLQVKQFPL